MPRLTDATKLRAKQVALRNAIAERQEQLKAVERSIASQKKHQQAQWERETGHLAWEAGMHQLGKETLRAMFAAWGKHQEGRPEKPQTGGDAR